MNYATNRACPSYGGSGYSGDGVGYSSGGNYASGNSGDYGNPGGNFDVSGGSGNFASRDLKEVLDRALVVLINLVLVRAAVGVVEVEVEVEVEIVDKNASLEGNFMDDDDEIGYFAKRAWK